MQIVVPHLPPAGDINELGEDGEIDFNEIARTGDEKKMADKSSAGELLRQAERIDALDGWRTVSVTLVIISHILLQSSIGVSDNLSLVARKIYIPLIEGIGYVGVDIFFVISGFVICRGFINENETFHRISLSAFYVRRSFRILPPLIMYVGTILVLSHFHVVDKDAQSVVRALTFTCNVPVGSCGGYLGGHTWSLSVEEQFYLIIPVSFSTLSAYRGVGLTGIAIMLPIVVLILDLFGQADVAEFLSHFCAIGIGVACALNERRMRNFSESLPQWLFYWAVVGIVILARLHNTRLWAVATLALAVVITYALLMTMRKISLAGKWLSTRPMRTVGRASYGLYLWQQLATAPFPGAGIVFYILSMCCCLLLVFASYLWIERPLMRMGAVISRRLQGDGPILGSHATSGFQ